jgi:hypothetical protein
VDEGSWPYSIIASSEGKQRRHQIKAQALTESSTCKNGYLKKGRFRISEYNNEEQGLI